MKKQHIIMLYCFLGFILFCGFFYGLNFYPLLDVDETRYVDMARSMFNTQDYLTLYLNGEYFFEKPPLYFWIECISFKLTGGVVSELSARLPIVLLSLLPASILLYLCKKIKNDKFAIITLMTLFTSLEYMFLTKLAILDSVLTSFVTSSVLCYFCTFFTSETKKKYFWMLTYIFAALAVLAKGIPGIAIPMLTVAVCTIIFKTYKETLKYSWGIFLFLIIVLPWHILMLKMYPQIFFDEYIYKHHILRFLGSSVINREQPWYFYLVTLLWGLCPHVFVLLSQIPKIKNTKIHFDGNYSKFLCLNLIAVLTILVFFSLSGSKMITYILPIYPFFSVLIGAIWYKYINNGDKNVHTSVILLNIIFTIAIPVLIFIKLFMSDFVYKNFQTIQIVSLAILIPFVIFNWIYIVRKRRLKLFLSYAIMMSLLSGFVTPYVYWFDYSFGQNDLLRYAAQAKNKNYTISTYLTGKKYSLLYYGNQPYIEFQTKKNPQWLLNELNKKNHIVIIRNDEIANLPVTFGERGRKYSIIRGENNEK